MKFIPVRRGKHTAYINLDQVARIEPIPEGDGVWHYKVVTKDGENEVSSYFDTKFVTDTIIPSPPGYEVLVPCYEDGNDQGKVETFHRYTVIGWRYGPDTMLAPVIPTVDDTDIIKFPDGRIEMSGGILFSNEAELIEYLEKKIG